MRCLAFQFHGPKFFTGLVALCFTLMLSACGFGSHSDGESALDNYHTRLSNVFERIDVPVSEIHSTSSVDAQALKPPKEPVKSASSDLKANIDILDFMSLYGCRLQETVGQSNSGLGRVAPNSQKLLFDIRFLRDAPRCIEQLKREENIELAQVVDQAYQAKLSSWPNLFALSVIGGDEFVQFWSVPNSLGDYPAQTNLEPVLALESLSELFREWSREDYTRADQEIESMLFNVSQGDGGSLLSSFHLMNRRLLALNGYLERVMMSPKICINGTYSRDILSNVVQKFFVGEVQLWASDLSRRSYALFDRLRSLEEVLDSQLTDEYKAWIEMRESEVELAKSLTKQHVSALGTLMSEEHLKEWCSSR